jgi:hypothetical protein
MLTVVTLVENADGGNGQRDCPLWLRKVVLATGRRLNVSHSVMTCYDDFTCSRLLLTICHLQNCARIDANVKSSTKWHLPASRDQHLPTHSLQVEGVILLNSAGN